MSKRKHDEFSADPANGNSDASHVSIPSHMGFSAALTKWVHSEIPATYPDLPKILNANMEDEALTHPARSNSANSYGYDRWEWLGDAQIETISSCFIFQTFSSLPPGKLAHLRELCVKNSTLAKFTKYYGLEKRAKLPTDWDLRREDGRDAWSKKEKEKVIGDLFEAYVGALIFSDPENGFDRASKWLKVLWGNTLKDIVSEQERKSSKTSMASASTADSTADSMPNLKPRERLARAIGAKGIVIEYKEITPNKALKDKISGLPLYRMGCYLTGWGYQGHCLGLGDALSKKEAAHKAAERALGNQKIMDILVTKKADFKAAMERQAEESS